MLPKKGVGRLKKEISLQISEGLSRERKFRFLLYTWAPRNTPETGKQQKSAGSEIKQVLSTCPKDHSVAMTFGHLTYRAQVCSSLGGRFYLPHRIFW